MVKVHMPNPRRASKRLAVLYFALLGIATVYSFFEYLEYGHDILPQYYCFRYSLPQRFLVSGTVT
jgi:hypothetical protein